MNPAMKRFLVFCGVILVASIVYFLYALSVYPPSPERETFLSEVGEAVGELAMWAFVFIYFRTVLKLALGKGPISKRLLPDYKAPKMVGLIDKTILQKVIRYLDRTHIYVGIAALALAVLHILMMGLHPEILFFPLVLALVVWQGLFGIFISWRGAPSSMKKWSYYVHAQLITGVAIGIFAYFGHLLIDS